MKNDILKKKKDAIKHFHWLIKIQHPADKESKSPKIPSRYRNIHEDSVPRWCQKMFYAFCCPRIDCTDTKCATTWSAWTAWTLHSKHVLYSESEEAHMCTICQRSSGELAARLIKNAQAFLHVRTYTHTHSLWHSSVFQLCWHLIFSGRTHTHTHNLLYPAEDKRSSVCKRCFHHCTSG